MTPGKTGSIQAKTFSDRDLLLHILEHVEEITAVLDDFRPLLEMFRPNGKTDMLGAAQAFRQGRALRRGRAGT